MTWRPFFKWEPFVPGSTQDGQKHIFNKIVKSNIPCGQENKYLCGLEFSEEPSTDIFIYLDMIDPLDKKETLENNMCLTCLQKLKEKYPILDDL